MSSHISGAQARLKQQKCEEATYVHCRSNLLKLVCLFILYLPACLPACLSLYLPACLSVYLHVSLSTCLSLYLPACNSVYLIMLLTPFYFLLCLVV